MAGDFAHFGVWGAFGGCGEGGCAGGAALVFALVGVLHEVGYVCAGGVVGGRVVEAQ